MTIHESLRRLRGDIKQDYLANKLGISQGYLCNLEKGRRTPTLEVLELYAAYFGKRKVEDVIVHNFLK